MFDIKLRFFFQQKRKLRIFISNTFYPGKPEGESGEEPTVPSWELRVEGRLLDDVSKQFSIQFIKVIQSSFI